MANIPLFEALCDALERRGEDYGRGRPSAVADPQDQRGLCVPCVQVRLNHDLLSNKTSIFLSFIIWQNIFSGQVCTGHLVRGQRGRPDLAPLLGGAGPGQPRRDGGGPYGGLVLTGINDNNNKTNRSTTSPPTFLPSVASSSGAWLQALIMAPALYSHRLEKRKISIRFQVN